MIRIQPDPAHAAPITRRGLGIEIHGGNAVEMLPRGSRAPASRASTFTTVSDAQRVVEVRVVGFSSVMRLEGVIGRMLLSGIRSAPRGTARIEIGIAIDRSGLLHLWAAERSSGACARAVYPCLAELVAGSRPSALAQMLAGFTAPDPSASAEAIRGEAAEILSSLRRAAANGDDALRVRRGAADGIEALQCLAAELAARQPARAGTAGWGCDAPGAFRAG